MEPELKKYLFDIKEAIDSIESFLGEDRDFKSCQNNKMPRRAVEREFGIIGEALTGILKIDQNISISSKHHIIGMRNRVMWGTIIRHLPKLKTEVIELLDK